MAYRLKLQEKPGQGVRRILREQTERCLAHLAEDIDPVAGVHETRKSIKRARALLRLVRPGLDKDEYRNEDARWRRIGRLLGGQRDRHVLLATLDHLEAEQGSNDDRHFALVRLAVESLSGPLAQGLDEAIVSEARRQLQASEARLDQIKLAPDDFDVIGAGLELTLKSCRKAYARAIESSDAGDWHNWRKTVQQHWRQMRLVERAWPEYFRARTMLASELSQVLGRAHDLALLQTFLQSTTCAAVAGDKRHAVQAIAQMCMLQHCDRARPLGKRLLAEGPKGLRRRVTLYWRTAVKMRAASAAPSAEGKMGKGRSAL